ncbi:helix-turn-helix domain-containing protein [Glycomyces salinus]|uniref:helix-turn-helix domain-containing protein n=1 Tax=Glycomyces salinus TaxID=980294 RepID=UPI0018EAE614|nr:Scr1 family TA system antitoxin-like transcriptional regulator [Glycomyces salinus]
MSDAQPTLARRAFGARIRRLREERGLVHREVAEALGYKRDAIRRMENGEQGIKLVVAKGLCEFFSIEGAEKSHLCELAVKSNERGWWEPFFDTVTGKGLRPKIPLFLETEQASKRIRVLELALIPGLAQTREYLLELDAAQPPTEEDLAEPKLGLRSVRQERLFSLRRPPKLEFLISTAAIDFLEAMPRKVRDGQIARLREINAMPFADVRVLTRINAGVLGAFNLLDPSDGLPPIVFMDHPDGSRYVEQPAVVSRFEQNFISAHDRAAEPLEGYLR